jgi:DnaJ like chaperone protein
MIYRDWNSFQQALADYNVAQARWRCEVERWERAVASFDRKRDKGGDYELDGVETMAGCALFVAGWIAYSHGRLGTQWLWIFPYGLAAGAHQTLDKWCRNYRKHRFVTANPRPTFSFEEPTFEPPTQSSAPPPRHEPPPQNQPLTLDAALAILGLTRQSTNEELKRSYRDRIRQYHPDRASHLGPELRELAERKAKEINAAYEYVSRAFQARTSA